MYSIATLDDAAVRRLQREGSIHVQFGAQERLFGFVVQTHLAQQQPKVVLYVSGTLRGQCILRIRFRFRLWQLCKPSRKLDVLHLASAGDRLPRPHMPSQDCSAQWLGPIETRLNPATPPVAACRCRQPL